MLQQDSAKYSGIVNDSAVVLTDDSQALASDSSSQFQAHYWHKPVYFDYSLSPFYPYVKQSSLFCYRLPHLYAENGTVGFQVVESIHYATETVADTSTKIQPDTSQISVMPDSVSTDSSMVDTVANVKFVVPLDYIPQDHSVHFSKLCSPAFLLETDSFNTANHLLVPVVFHYKAPEIEKTYFDKSEYVQIESINGLKKTWTDRDWLFWPILVVLVLFAYIRNKYRSFLNQSIIATFYGRMASRILKEKNESTSPIIQSLLFSYFTIVGLFVCETLRYYDFNPLHYHGFVVFIACTLLVAFVYFIRLMAVKIVGFIFMQQKVADEYIQNIKLFNSTLGVFLIPVVICIPFLNAYIINEQTLINVGVVIYACVFLLKLLRGFSISIRQNISVFYIFLYLCALEILPLALLLKLAIR